ncbi:isoprenylcysteine carboxylmethyltransferase family protein [Acaryochloris sp. CCMEE 5410]|uniref:methyltransferase family protein n=1 Tax=Acaryochloris sp. CCMEE 5410 TaxID=310037 RepID=UPI0002483996|nr:isoprenylcysteine carboxylmethyltransferase family protein [Acaryochloris sp. CCMEE 5410]KAI9131413.1 isoprenylcysteine carboxylmethyltransferase family protein [Acaryochloris sp. CCMEE 5410]
MQPTALLIYPLIIVIFGIERVLRKGQTALNLNPGEMDKGSSKRLWASSLFNLIIILAAPWFGSSTIGSFPSAWMGWFGIITILFGIGLRSWAALTLGQYYTRTLTTLEDQCIIDYGPYRWIRHPGYLATSIIDIGAGLAVMNWLVLLALLLSGLTAKVYRIQVEEEMLTVAFGPSYQQYADTTWRLLPFLY